MLEEYASLYIETTSPADLTGGVGAAVVGGVGQAGHVAPPQSTPVSS